MSMKKLATIVSCMALFAASVAVIVTVFEAMARRRDMFDDDCCCDDGCDCDCECGCYDDEVFEEDLSFEPAQDVVEEVVETVTEQTEEAKPE